MFGIHSSYLKLLLVLSLVASLAEPQTFGAVPQTITFQGRLSDSAGEPLADGTYTIRLVIYDSPIGGAILWGADAQSISVTSGLFSYVLGSNVSFPASLFSDTGRYLGITIDTDPELAPRIPFRSVPFTIEASHSDSSEVSSFAHAALTATQADSSMFSQIAELALSANVATAADSAALADSAKIAANANALAGMSPDFYLDWNSITNMPLGFADGVDNGAAFSAGAGLQLVAGVFSIQTAGVTEQLIADNAVTAVKIATDAVGSSEVQNNSLTSIDLATNSVGSSEIINNSITSVDLASNSVGSAEIVAGAIDSTKIADSSITGADVAPNSISPSHLTASAFTSSEILDEPGVAQITGAWFLTGTSLTTISSLAITAPANGYVMALASFEMKATHVFGIASQAIVGLSNINTALATDQNKNVDIPNTANSGTYTSIVSLQRIFTVSAGANTFYLLGRKTTSASPTWSTFDVTFSLVYYPTAYGTVSVDPPTPPLAPLPEEQSPGN